MEDEIHFLIQCDQCPGGDSLTFGTGVLMCLFGVLNFGVLNFEVQNDTICGLKFGVGEIILDLIFLVYHCPSHFLSIKFFFETGQLIICGL